MRRNRAKIVSTLSVLLFATTIGLWVYWACQPEGDPLEEEGLLFGGYGILYYHATFPYNGSIDHVWSFSNLAFGLEKDKDATKIYPNWFAWEFGISWWFLAILTISPFIWLQIAGRLRQRRLARAGYCACEYDLTGNVSGICPECGSKIPYNSGSPAAAEG